MCIQPGENVKGDTNINALVDTGAANSLIHMDIAKKFNLKYEKCRMTICTATGTDTESIKGIAHIKFRLKTTRNEIIETCANFIVTEKLNDLQCILGADFLMNSGKVTGVSPNSIIWKGQERTYRVKIADGEETHKLDRINKYIASYDYKRVIKQTDECTHCNKKLSNGPLDQHTIYTTDDQEKPIVISTDRDQAESIFKQNHIEIEDDRKSIDRIEIFSHSMKGEYENETLPESTEMFDDSQELKEEVLTKKISLEDGDYSECPPEHLGKLKALLTDFKDRFSESKLDLEITDMYTADLETLPNKKVNQKCRRLPTDRFEFAKKAIKQLMDMGVVSESDSEWRSNVVMVPKPQTGELRENSKSDMLDKTKKVELFRICLDFRELNNCLVFPKQVQFVNLELLLHKLKNKVCVSMDISSAFFIIPIRKEDRYKTAFWVNDLSYEFNCLVMGLKSSPYHLKMFMNIVFSAEQYEKLKKQLSKAERDLLPPSFDDLVISYFDDCFVFADTYEQLYVCFKICLMAAREAKIKFSIEKTTFFTTKIKVLGYSFDTKDALLTMDRLKSSAITNMKKPSSLFELHSRLCAFQYQSMFLPYLKHILYPLHYMLRKREWHWGPVEEEAWTIAKQLSGLGLKLTIPDATDDLVLTTDASKVAASACLFRVRDNKLDLVAVNSKYFNVTDLNKCSYILESIALAYGLKVFASYILNCEGRIKIFTDARSLIYCKRNATHSILLNSTLNYLTNFVSLTNIEIYHLPGDVNILADVMSRAIADNLNCALNREHPISKQWAKEIPPIPDNFSVDRDTLFKFLTTPLKPEIQDKHDRRMRKLSEPKSVQQWFDIAKGATSEERFYNSVRLLEQWNDNYNKHEKLGNISIMALTPKEKRAKEALSRLLTEKNKECSSVIEEILNKIYADIKNTPLYKKVRNSLTEASKQLIKINLKGLTDENVKSYTHCIDKIMRDVKGLVPKEKLPSEDDLNNATLNKLYNTIPSHIETDADTGVKATWECNGRVHYKPYVERGTLILRSQNDIILRPNEIVVTDLGVRTESAKKYTNIMSPHKYNKTVKISMNTGILCAGHNDYCKISVQNNGENVLKIPGGAPLVSVETHKLEGEPEREWKGERIDPAWQELERDEDLVEVRDTLSLLNPGEISVGTVKITILGNQTERLQIIDELRGFDNELIWRVSPKLENSLPALDINHVKEENEATKSDTQAMLAADLLEHSRISVETLMRLQAEDENIKTIRENLTGNPEAYNTYLLKSGVVCKKFTIHHAGVTHLGIYVPSSILRAVVQYVHRKSLHTSVTQTYKEFAANYYHPRAMKEVKNICRECIICAQSRNEEKRNIKVGRERTLKPERPREGISADILYFPKSTSGYTHGLLIGDLFSLYISFYPMKSKGSAEVAQCFRAYFAAQGVPKSIYTDSDNSFRGLNENLFRTYGVTHVTSYPYTQKENAIESQVRIFKNAYRAAILENNIFKIPQWDVLYPLVICRINALISKYGMSRESVHFGTVVESSLPLITDCELFSPLEDDLKQLSDRFRDKIGKFLMRKKRKKELYKIGKQWKFYMYELVMKAEYTAESMLAAVYKGPYRIVNLDAGGARLKDIKTGEELSASFEHMRKIKLDELLTLLPQNFDAEINQVLDTYRYRRTTATEDTTEKGPEKIENTTRRLRSGRLYNMKIETVGEKLTGEAETVYWRPERIYNRGKTDYRPILIAHSASEREMPFDRGDLEKREIVKKAREREFKRHMDEVERRQYKRKKTSTFSSASEGTMIIRFRRSGDEKPGTRVKFKEILIHFF
jgi:hypothetical protein